MTTNASAPPDADPVSLYERVGGDPAIRAVMDGFFARILGDPELAPIFERVNIERHSRRTAAFVAAATGGPTPWAGRDMESAHRALRVTNEQFDRVAGHLNDTLAAMSVPEPLAGELLILVGSLRAQIVGAADRARSGGNSRRVRARTAVWELRHGGHGLRLQGVGRRSV
jgi:truncated hemoglobin YjbI